MPGVETLRAGRQEPEAEQRQRSHPMRIPSPAISSALACDWAYRPRRQAWLEADSVTALGHRALGKRCRQEADAESVTS